MLYLSTFTSVFRRRRIVSAMISREATSATWCAATSDKGIQWFGSAQSIKNLVEIDSKIDLHDKNAPHTIFMGFHFVSIEVGCILYSTSARRIEGLLRSGKLVMLAADMDHGIDNSVFVPFFGVPACTLTSVSPLPRLGRARVVPFVTEVLPHYRGYELTVYEPFEDFPSESDVTDARRTNTFPATQILKYPEQYYWVHRRIKHRPPGKAGVY